LKRPELGAGTFSDAGLTSVYQAIESGEIDAFVDTVQTLAEAFVSGRIDYVAGDAVEGYNPTHDLCRYLIDAAIAVAEKNRNRRVTNYEFLLVGRPDACPESLRDDAIQVELDEAALQRKLTAAYQYGELKAEVDAAVQKFGITMFRTEYLLPASPSAALNKFNESVPYYETYGQQQVGAGHYNRVIRYAEHVAPLVQSLRETLDVALPSRPPVTRHAQIKV
jgi:hypothetical protein